MCWQVVVEGGWRQGWSLQAGRLHLVLGREDYELFGLCVYYC